jgi:hypothetical protein
MKSRLISFPSKTLHKKVPVGRNHARHHNRSTKTVPMPPHLHRRTPLRQSVPPPGGVLLLPSHHPQACRRPPSAPQPPLRLPPAATRGPLRYPVLHRRSPAANRLQRHRPPPRRPPPLRPPDREPQPGQNPTCNPNCRRTRNHRRNHRRPHSWRSSPTSRSLRNCNTQKPYRRTDRVHNSKRSGRSRLTQPHHPPNPPGHGKYRSIEPCLRPPPNLARARAYLFNSSPFSTRSAITSIPTLSKQSFVDFSSIDCVSYSYRRCYLRRAAISGNTSWSGC